MDELDKMVDDLAKDVIEVARRLDDDRLVDQIAQALGEGSQVAEERFMSSVRFRRSVSKARMMLNSRIKQAKAARSG